MRKNKGFTLIELLIVMAVIAILIAIAIPSFRGMQNEARKTKAQGDVRVEVLGKGFFHLVFEEPVGIIFQPA